MLLEVILAIFLSLLLLAGVLKPVNILVKSTNKLKETSKFAAPVCKSIKTIDSLVLEKCSLPNSKDYLRITNKDLGFSVLEIILATFIGLTILGISSKTFAHFYVLARRIDRELNIRSSAIRISSEIERVFNFSEKHPLLINPIIHAKGEIRLKNGQFNQIHFGSQKLKPKTDSSSITNNNLSIFEILDIKNCQNNGNIYQGQACLRLSANLEEYDSFLLFSLDGFQEGLGKVSGKTSCKTFSLASADGMLFNSIESPSKCNLISIIPIKSTQTVYLSEGGDFRLITHRQDKNVENQPITLAYPELGIDLQLQPLTLDTRIKSLNKIIFSRTLVRSSAAYIKLNLFLNQ